MPLCFCWWWQRTLMFTHVAYVCCCRARCMPVWQLHCRYTWSLSTQRDRTFRSNVPCPVPGSWSLINTHTIHVLRYLQNIGADCGMPIQCIRLYPCVRGTCAFLVCRHTLCLQYVFVLCSRDIVLCVTTGYLIYDFTLCIVHRVRAAAR